MSANYSKKHKLQAPAENKHEEARKKRLAETEAVIRTRLARTRYGDRVIDPDLPPEKGLETLAPWLALAPSSASLSIPRRSLAPPSVPLTLLLAPKNAKEGGKNTDGDKKDRLDLDLKL